jgi:hypothetical protein
MRKNRYLEPNIRGLQVIMLAGILWLNLLSAVHSQEIQISLPAGDVIYVPFTQKIYASIADGITVIDPYNGNVGPTYHIGNGGKLAISDDGRYLYVASSDTVRRFDLFSKTSDLEFSLGNDPDGGGYFLTDIKVLPGQPESIAVARRAGLFSIAIYDNGIKRPNETTFGPDVIEFSSSASVLYGCRSDLQPTTTLYKMTIDEEGIASIEQIWGTLDIFGSNLKHDNGLLYMNSGQVIDPDNGIVGQFQGLPPTYKLVRPDSSVGLVFFLTLDGDIIACDQNTLQAVFDVNTSAIYWPFVSFIRWGENGLAFISDFNKIFLVTSSLIPEPPNADLALSLNVINPGNPTNWTYTIQNFGPNKASYIAFTDAIYRGADIVSATPSQGFCGTANPIQCNLGILENGAQATIEMVIIPTAGEDILHTARIFGYEPDPDLTNNAIGPYSPDYFPTLSGTIWTYLEDGSKQVTMKVLSQTVDINGIETSVFYSPERGSKDYYTSDSNGIRLHRTFLPRVFIQGLGRVNLTLTFDPPISVTEGIIGIRQLKSTGIARTNRLPVVGVMDIPYNAEFTGEALEIISVPAGDFEVFRFYGTVEVYGITIFQTVYLAKDIGIVKSIATNLAGIESTIELVNTNAGIHDLAVTQIVAPKRVTLTSKNPTNTALVKVTIQNRSPHPETIQDLTMFKNFVTLMAESLGTCTAPAPILRTNPPQKNLPIILKPKGSLTVFFDVTLNCANDPAASTLTDPNHSDYRFIARVNHAALDGKTDTDRSDDLCPRSVPPPFLIDPNPDGTIRDKGCGGKKPDGTYGADVLTDIIVK